MTASLRSPSQTVASSRVNRAGNAISRLQGSPLWVHALVLTLVLVAGGELVGYRSSFNPDEGAVIRQAQLLSGGHGWFERPALLARIDPDGRWYGAQNPGQTARGFAPFAKHPAYAVLCAVAYRLGGVRGIIWLSIFGTVAAALLSAALARRLDTALAVPCLWAVGIASPLFFDSYVAIASTIGAALGMAGVVAIARELSTSWAPRLTSRSQNPTPIASSLLGFSALGAATLFRSEAFLMAAALALITGLIAVRRRRLSLGVLAAAPLGGALLARKSEALMMAHILGRSAGPMALEAAGIVPGQPYITARIAGFWHTWIQPSSFGVKSGDAVLIVSWVLVGATALIFRRRRPDAGIAIILAAAISVSGVARLLIKPQTPIPGLLLAFPLLWGGSLLISTEGWASLQTLSLGTAALFSAGVLATQYSVGGILEWGGRYFTMAIPVVIPGVLYAIQQRRRTVGPALRQAGALALLGASVPVALLALVSMVSQHRANERLNDTIGRLSAGPGRPVVLSTAGWQGNMSWDLYWTRDWLSVSPDEIAVAASLVAHQGVRELTIVSYRGGCLSDRLSGWRTVARAVVPANGRVWQVSTVTKGTGDNSCSAVPTGSGS